MSSFQMAGQNAFIGMGLTSPYTRFAAGAALGTIAAEAVKSDITHTKEGQHRAWLLIDPSAKENGTMLPWFMPGLLTGFTFALFF
jgi:hypothetical protein